MASTPPSTGKLHSEKAEPKLVDFKTECSFQKLSVLVAVNFESFERLLMVMIRNRQPFPSLGLIVDRRANAYGPYDHLMG